MMSPSVIPPTPWWITETRTSGCWIFAELGDGRLDRADHVALEHEVQVPDRALLHRLEEVLERQAALRALRELLAAEALAARLRELAGGALVLDDAALLACGRRLVEAEDLDRDRRGPLP